MDTIAKSAMHLADPNSNVPKKIDPYIPPKKQEKKKVMDDMENTAQEPKGANPTPTHTHDDGLHLDRRNYRKHNERNKALIN